MRSLGLRRLCTVAALARSQSSGGSRRYPRHEQQHQRCGGSHNSRPEKDGSPQVSERGCHSNRLNEPQLVAKLLELFPSGKPWLPVNKWALSIPEDLQEALVPYGGLAQFAVSQSNFFIVRKENGLTVLSLSTMASSLCAERAKNIRKREERAAAFNTRRRDDSRRPK